MLNGRLLDNNSHRCESLADFSYPIVLLKGRKSGGDRFIESLRGDLYGVLNALDILYRNCADPASPLPVLRTSPHVFPTNEFVLQLLVKLLKLFRIDRIA